MTCRLFIFKNSLQWRKILVSILLKKKINSYTTVIRVSSLFWPIESAFVRAEPMSVEYPWAYLVISFCEAFCKSWFRDWLTCTCLTMISGWWMMQSDNTIYVVYIHQNIRRWSDNFANIVFLSEYAGFFRDWVWIHVNGRKITVSSKSQTFLFAIPSQGNDMARFVLENVWKFDNSWCYQVQNIRCTDVTSDLKHRIAT